MMFILNRLVLSLLLAGGEGVEAFAPSTTRTIKCRTITTQSTTTTADRRRLFYGPAANDYDYERQPPIPPRGDYFPGGEGPLPPRGGEGYPPPPPPPPGGEPYFDGGNYGSREEAEYEYGGRQRGGIGGLPRGEYYDYERQGPGRGGFYPPPPPVEQEEFLGRNADRFYGTSMNSRQDFNNFYEQRSYDELNGGGGGYGPGGGFGAAGGGPGGFGGARGARGGGISDRFPDIGQNTNTYFSQRFNNFKPQRGETLDRRIRSRKNTSSTNRGNRNFKAVGLNSDNIPGRDQEYAESKDYAPTRRREEGGFGSRSFGFGGGAGGNDLWSHVFDGTRSAVDNVMRRTAAPWVDRHFAANLSVDLKEAMRDQQQTLQPLLEEALTYVQGDPACRDLLGGDIRFDQPFRQTQESVGLDEMSGIPQESRINVQVAAVGTRGRGSLDIFANNLGIREMILTCENRRINVKLGGYAGLPDGIDLVDRTSTMAPRPALNRPMPEDVLDAEFEVMNNNNNVYNNNTRW